MLEQPAYVLFDTGASPTFMSEKFMKKVGIVGVEGKTLNVCVPSGNTIKIATQIKGLNIVIDDHEIETDFHVLDMKYFDIILGIDWLTRNKVVIKCAKWEIDFKTKDGESFTN